MSDSWAQAKAMLIPLPSLYHSEIEYDPFRKVFYREHPDIQAMSKEEVKAYRELSRMDPCTQLRERAKERESDRERERRGDRDRERDRDRDRGGRDGEREV